VEHLAPGAPADVAPHERDVPRDALDRVPPHLPVVWRHVRGCARRRILQTAGADDRRLVLVGRLPWWARGALRRRRIGRLVILPDAPAVADGRPVALRDRAGTLA